MRAMDHRPMAKAGPRPEHDRLARIDVQAAQILDVALRAHHDLVVVSPQDGAVPDIDRRAQRYPADHHRPRCDPGAWADRGSVTFQRSDQAHGDPSLRDPVQAVSSPPAGAGSPPLLPGPPPPATGPGPLRGAHLL